MWLIGPSSRVPRVLYASAHSTRRESPRSTSAAAEVSGSGSQRQRKSAAAEVSGSGSQQQRKSAAVLSCSGLNGDTKKRPPGLPPRIPTAALRVRPARVLSAGRTPAARTAPRSNDPIAAPRARSIDAVPRDPPGAFPPRSPGSRPAHASRGRRGSAPVLPRSSPR